MAVVSDETRPLTRSARRAQRQQAVTVPTVQHVVRPIAVLVTLAFAGLLATAVYADRVALTAAVLLTMFLFAWSWPALTGNPNPLGSAVVLAVTAVLCVAAVVPVGENQSLRYLPVAVSGGIGVMFVQQLARRDGRPRLTEAVALTSLGIAVIASGAGYLPLIHTWGGPEVLAGAAAAVAVAAVTDLAIGIDRTRAWLLPITMLLGGVAAVVVAMYLHAPSPRAAALIGVLVAGFTHVLRRVLGVLPSLRGARAQIASGTASVLLVGAIVYLLDRVLAG